MKLRQGFVSNSSSSSFIVYIPKGFKFTDDDYHIECTYVDPYDFVDFCNQLRLSFDTLLQFGITNNPSYCNDIISTLARMFREKGLILKTIKDESLCPSIYLLRQSELPEIMFQKDAVE